jgi:predicted O-methyltransferase YrrM
MTKPVASLCIATYNKAAILDRVLLSILNQNPVKLGVEVIIVDDFSTDATSVVCKNYIDFRYHRIRRPDGYRNPGVARNVAAKMARGDILVLQSDDVIHYPGSLRLLLDVPPGTMQFAKVINQYPNGELHQIYTGPTCMAPFFFLGSLRREDFYAVGGNDDHFGEAGYDDAFLAKCLMNGRGLTPVFRTDSVGFHQDHVKPDISGPYRRMGLIYDDKLRAATSGDIPWHASGGPWNMHQSTTVMDTKAHKETPMTMNQTGHETFIPELCKLLQARDYLELGVHKGSTLCRVAAALPECHCQGVDIVNHELPLPGNVSMAFMRTDEFFETWKKSSPVRYDVIFIDANHSYEAVKADLEMALQMLQPRGVLLLHDTHPVSDAYTESGWCGDAFRILNDLQANPDLQSITLPYHPGLTIVRPAQKTEFPWG